MAPDATVKSQTGNEISFVRTFDAPRELAFEVFTTAAHIKRWWGPRGWPVTKCIMDFRVGGTWRYCMQGPDGTEYWNNCVYQEIAEPEHIVFTDNSCDADGNPTDDIPPHTKTITFVEQGGKTIITTRISCASDADARVLTGMGLVAGYTNTSDNLDQYLRNYK